MAWTEGAGAARRASARDADLPANGPERDLGAKAWVDNGVFSDHGLQAAGLFLVDSGLLKQVPPVETWVDRRFLPIQLTK